MRTTLTIDDDVAIDLRREMRESGSSLKQAVNAALRRGLAKQRVTKILPPYEPPVHRLGNAAKGIDLSSVSQALEDLEGPIHR